MRAALVLTLVLLALPVLPTQADPLPAPTGERVFVLVMDGTDFNYQSEQGPLLEAFLGEALNFYVVVPPTAEAHVFHLHGHPWWDTDTGRFIDAKIIHPGDYHEFSVLAGGEEADRPGDWLYHCHMDAHFEGGMWGILRVYPYSTEVTGTPGELTVRLHQAGAPVTGAELTVSVGDVQVPSVVEETAAGTYEVRTGLTSLSGERLVVTAQHELGKSVARLEGSPVGLEQVRTVGDPAWIEQATAEGAPSPSELVGTLQGAGLGR